MAQEITLPVKLQIENLQNVTKEMRSQLGTLKVDSSGYKKLESVIMDIEKRIQQLQVISSRPFVDTKQFTAVSKEILGIQDDLTKVRIEAGKVKFSDLQLDASQKAKLQEFDNQIKSVNDSLKQVKDSAKNTFFETDIGKAWKLNHTEDAGKTFTQITKIIEGEVAKQEKALHDAEQAYADYQERLAAKRKLSQFIKNGHGLTKENLGEDIYNSIFDKNGNFKSGGKTALQTWLEEQFKLDHNIVQSLTDQAGKKVREAFENTKDEVDRALKQERTRINANLTEEGNRTNKGQTYTQDIVAAQASLDTAKAAKEGLSQTNLKLAKTEEELSNQLRKTKLDRDSYTQSITRSATEQLQMGSSCDKARTQLDSLNHTVDIGKTKLASLDQATSKLQGISNFVNRYVGAYAIIRKVTQAIRNAFSNIKELDKVITSIAVVTNMSQEDLWNKIGQYTAMAQEYGVATKDVYTVSQIFYQQGLQTAQVMDLTTETLKMAKIAGMGYSEAANAMTVAVRAFNIEMENAQRVTDTYSALAAKFAVSSAEIANAMEKTASSAASVGMSIESASAFISVMEQTTRESAQNIGSALKSIISRYGEMKASPDKLINVDGEEVAFNKVDTALSSVGISIKDINGQFRDFDDVIMELASKWNTLDNNTQRYIATIMAGNRQQSRFIALVSNYDELSRAMQVASNAENASIVQVAKTMDSLETKTNQLKNAFSQLYLDLHIETGLKSMYDWLTRILQTIGKLGTLKGAIPTLMNIVGFGTGTKGLISEISKGVASRKLKLEADTQEFENKIRAIEERASQPIVKKFDVDISAIETAEQRINSMAGIVATNISSQLAKADTTGILSSDSAKNVLIDAQKNGLLNTEQGRAQFLTNMKIDPNANQGLMTLLGQFNGLTAEASNLQTALGLVTNAAGTAGTADQQKADAAVAAAAAADAEAQQRVEAAALNHDAAQAEFKATQDLANSHVGTTKAALDAAEAEKKKTAEVLQAALREKQSADKKAQTTEGEIQSQQEEINANNESTASELEEAKANRDAAKHEQNVMKGIGLASSIARMAGTTITALGAGYQDKSTNTVEASKIFAGFGNGVSMAGTGASMGMAFGWKGALVGSIVGFLAGGIGAIIDGLHMSLDERLALEKEEAKKKSDEALKAQAKALDIDSSLDNLKQLRAAMYNSAEDAEKYTDAMNTLGQQYPGLISSYDSMGNAIIDLQDAEQYLIGVRQEASRTARETAQAEMQTRNTQIEIFDNFSKQIANIREFGNAEGNSNNADLYRVRENNESDHEIAISKTTGKALDKLFEDLVNKEYLSSDARDIVSKYNQEGFASTTWEEVQSVIKSIPEEIQQQYSSKNSGHMDSWDGIYDLLNGKQYSYAKSVSSIDDFLKKYATDLGIAENTTARDYFNWGEGSITLDMIADAENRINAIIDGYKRQVEVQNRQVTRAFAEEQLGLELTGNDNISNDRNLKISNNKIFSSLITAGLEREAKQITQTQNGELIESGNAATWSISDQKGEFIAKKAEITKSIVDWISKQTDSVIDSFIEATGEMDSFLSADELLNKFNVDKESELGQDLIAQFAEQNQINRDRIVKTIYGQDEKGGHTWKLNSSFEKGLGQLNNGNQALDIAYKFLSFDGATKIVSEYADYFTTQLLDINKLAEDGYTELASQRLNILSTIANRLSEIKDSSVQNDLFSVLTTTDFTDFDSLVKTADALQTYVNGHAEEAEQVLPILEQINIAKDKLIFNANTLIESISEQIGAAAKEIDSVLSTNKSGLDLSKALDTLQDLNITKSAEDAFGFDEIFTYDSTLGAYVYTQEGLKEAIAKTEGNLQDEVTQLQKTLDTYVSDDSLETLRGASFLRDINEDTTGSDLASTLYTFTDMNLNSRGVYEKLANEFLSSSTEEEKTWDNFITFLEERRKSDEELKQLTDQELKAYKANMKNQYFQNIDWSALALGTDYYGTNRTLLESLAPLVGKNVGDSWDVILEGYLATIENESVRNATRAQINDSIIADKVSQYQSAISELLTYDADGYLSQETQNLASRMGIHLDDIHDRADGAINAAEMFLSKLAAQIGKGQYTLEQYNQDASSILEKSITNQTLGKTLLDFASEDDIGASQLEGLANSLNIQLTDLVDVSTGALKDEILKEHLAFDKNTGTYKINGLFSDFVKALNDKYDGVIVTTSQEYIDALSAFNDDQISKAEKAHKAISDELNKVVSSNGGEQINLANTYSKLGGKITGELELTLKKLGAEFSKDGILTLVEGANIPAIAQELANLAEKNAALIPSELEALSDAIQDLLSSITDNITSGITGKLSNSGARDLQTWAKNNGIQSLDFTKTKNGLKLSQKSAKELYDTLKQIDTISAEIVLDALNESIEESVTNTKKLSGEIAELRATTESDDFKFMDHDIPSGQNNPLNYFENWTKAFKAMNEASKATGKDHNKIAYEDFYNIITEMGNLAETVGGDGIKIGNEIVSSSETAAALIEKGAAALSVAADGTLKVDLGKLGIDFASGAADLKKDVGAGIKEVAKSQIAMLDSMIQLLETIVAMEELGNIDVEGNGIDLSEMFQMDGDNFILDENDLVQWTEGMHTAAEKILASADELGPDSDLYKGLENVKVNGTSLRQIFEQARDNISVDADTAKAYHAAISAFYAAMQSGDYNLNDIMSSIKEVLAGTDFEGNIDVGDMHLTFHKGIVLERDKDGNYIVDGQKYDENHLNAALQAQAVSDLTKVQNAVKEYDPETGEVTYTAGEFKYTASYDVDSGLYEVHFSDGDSATSSSKDGINLAISTWAKKNALTQEELGSEAPENTTFTYTSHTGVTVDAEVDVETGEIKFNTSDGLRNAQQDVEVAKIEESIKAVTAETVAAANAKLKESGETNSIEGTEITVKDPTVKLADGTELKLDLSGQKITASGADIELENVEELSEKSPVEIDVTVDKSQEAYNKLRELQEETETLDNMHPFVDVDVNDYITDKINAIKETIGSLQGKTVDVVTNYISNGSPPSGGGGAGGWTAMEQATGNVGLAHAKGTLMGELGPELVVSNGRYFVAGQNGAEFVDLADDAIVFNHLQTESLFKHGMSKDRGRAVTNERNAIAFAQGNVNGGPAMASARAALAALKQLRAQWQAIANMGPSDLAGLGGSGGGGGGGGDKAKEMKAFVKQLEIWYNWLQRIAVLEQKINYEEAKRSEINSSFHPDGEEYVKSQKKSLDYLLEQAAVEKSLYESQQKYFEKRRNELNKNNGPFDQLYTFDEYGQLKYKDGKLEELSKMSGRDEKGKPNKTAAEQYDYIINQLGVDSSYMAYDSSGTKIDKTQEGWEVQAVQAFWDKIESDQQEMQNLHDSIEEHKENYLKLEEEKNEIMHEMEDNQISLEKQVLAAVEESRQREIDELQKQRDAIQKASDNLIDGLSQQLQKERDMYSQKESGEELTKLQRQLAILQRSGGSASQIAALQKEISQKQQDTYFELQQAQIDALQEASDAEIEKLDAQIDLMTETLEYEKLHGMLWDQVYQVLQTSPQEIANFIRDNTKSYWGQSPTELAKTVREDLFSAEKFLAQGKYLGSISEIVTKYDEEATKKKAEEEKKKEEEEKKKKKKKKDNSGGSSSSSGGTTKVTAPTSSSSSSSSSGTESYSCNNDYTHAVYRNGTKVRDESHTGSTSCSKCGWIKQTTTSTGGSIAAGILSAISTVKPPKKAEGGYAKHGIYELGEKGTEGVLTAEQTQVLRNNILSNRPNSLISLLKSYNEGYGNINDSVKDIQQVNDNSIVIEHAEVSMNVSRIANDYDAQRAGEQALEKMVQIARKTQGQNRIGR